MSYNYIYKSSFYFIILTLKFVKFDLVEAYKIFSFKFFFIPKIMIGGILNRQNYLSSTDFVMIAVIMLSYRYKMNPDNLATPLAASIGDVVSISILSAFASEFYVRMENEIWVLYIVLGVFLVLMPIWIIIVLKNKYTRKVLKSGWVPILSALLISGLVIKMAILLGLSNFPILSE